MTNTRREFLERSLAVSAGGLLLPKLGVRAPHVPVLPASKAQKILILGGTGFIGPHMVRYAMYRGHEVTLFNRGKTSPTMFPGVESLTGDRDGKLDSLKGRKWDAVIDNSGYVPRHVRDSANLLKDAVGRYLFISTGSVYGFDIDEIDEDSPLLPIADPKSEDVNKFYGPLKVLCEQAVREAYGPRSTILRLHIVSGPGDPTNRFTYWPVRIDRGGEVIAPGAMVNPVQTVDVRDLAEFTIHSVERGTSGTYNAAGPAQDDFSMAEFLYGIRAITSARVGFTWLDEAFLTEKKVGFPMWVPYQGKARGAVHVRSNRGIAAGLKFRPLAVTALDTLEWFKAEPVARQQELKLELERDAGLLTEWKARSKKGS